MNILYKTEVTNRQFEAAPRTGILQPLITVINHVVPGRRT